MRVHHTAIWAADLEESLRFWRDGIGLVQLTELRVPGDWPTLFDAPDRELSAVFLGDPASPECGIIELVTFASQVDDREARSDSKVGFFLVNIRVDIEATLDRLRALGLGGEPRRIVTPGGATVRSVGDDGAMHEVVLTEPRQMAVVFDPNGVMVELTPVAPAR